MVGKTVSIGALVDKIRMRGEVAWVTFTATAAHDDGSLVLESTSLFLMSADEPPGDAALQPEPEPFEKAIDEAVTAQVLPEVGEALTPLRKSASRSDLIRYAAASGDFNPLHWDHEVAAAAGLPRIVCHGLLSASWALQEAARHASGPLPVSEARVRFKQPLLAGDQALVRGTVDARDSGSARLGIAVETGGEVVVDVTATVTP